MREPLRLVDETNDPEMKRLLLAAKHDGPGPSAETRERVQAAVLEHFRAQRGAPRSGLRETRQSTNEQPALDGEDEGNSPRAPKRDRSWKARVFVALAMAAVFAAVALISRLQLPEETQLAAPTMGPSTSTMAIISDAGPSAPNEIDPDEERRKLLLIALDPDAGPDVLEALTPEQRARVERIRRGVGVSGSVTNLLGPINARMSTPHETAPLGSTSSTGSAAPSQEPPKPAPKKKNIKPQQGKNISFGE